MIEVTKYVEQADLPEESVKILLETTIRVLSKAKNIKKICSDALEISEDNPITPEEAMQILHIFRSELYIADLSVSKIQEALDSVYCEKEEAETSEDT